MHTLFFPKIKTEEEKKPIYMTDGVDERIMHEYIYLRNCGVARLILATVRLYEMKASLGLFRGRGLLRARFGCQFSSLHSPPIHKPSGEKEEKRAREKKEG
jgi:hypothetical protein